MNFRILGAAPGIPTLGLHHAAVAGRACQRIFLLDAGEGVSKQLKRAYLDGEALDFVAVSHYHPDHVAGLFMLLQMLKLQHREKALDIYLPERVEDMEQVMDMLYLFPSRSNFPLRLLPMEQLHANEPFITPVASDHMNGYAAYVKSHGKPNALAAWSFIVEEQDKRAIYTGDVQSLAPLDGWFDGADLLVLDALHPEANDIAALAQRNIRRIVLTHGMSTGLQALTNNHPTFEIANETTDYAV